MTSEWLWKLHTASVFFMCGAIWIVQWVHYPLMRYTEASRFSEFHTAHSTRITAVVLPPMLLQLSTAMALVLSPEAHDGPMNRWVALGLTFGVFLSTALLSVPCHSKLASGFQAKAHQRLVATNWPRTLLWSFHASLLLS